MKTQMVKWGNSMAVRIPAYVVKEARLKQGDSLEIEVSAEGHVQLRRPTKIPTLVELVAKITPENRYAAVSVGVEVGKEVVDW
jgi:antitoxin MazE